VVSRAEALHEMSEPAMIITAGILSEEGVKSDVVELIKELHLGKTSSEELTLFKSVGLAIEDLTAALLVYKSYNCN